MGALRSTKQGLIIPPAWVKGMGQSLSVQRTGNLIIIESADRIAARRRLTRMVKKLRRASRSLRPLTPEVLDSEINKVRRQRAGRH